MGARKSGNFKSMIIRWILSCCAITEWKERNGEEQGVKTFNKPSKAAASKGFHGQRSLEATWSDSSYSFLIGGESSKIFEFLQSLKNQIIDSDVTLDFISFFHLRPSQ
jgi:hypothetical protein